MRTRLQTLEQKPTDLAIKLSKRQAIAWRLLAQDDVIDLCYGGAKGGGKSVFLCYWVYTRAVEIARHFNLGPREHPIPVGWMGRSQGTDFKHTTLETWKKVIPPGSYRIREQEQEIVIGEAVKVGYGGLDRQERINKFNSAELNFIAVDQAEEVDLDAIGELRGSRRLTINGQTYPVKGVFTANPAQCWIKGEFIDRPTPDKRFVQALPTDNPWLDPNYVNILKSAFKHRPELLEAYLYGSWDALEGADQIIKDIWIRNALERTLHLPRTKRLIVCDPARFGDDETVIYLMENTDIVEAHLYGQKDTMHTANLIHILAVAKKVQAVGIDTIGVGGGVADRLREMADDGYEVIDINSSEASRQPERYVNLRAEMWDRAGHLLCDGDVDLTYDEPQLRHQLCTPVYKFRNGRLQVEAKEDIKDRLGVSPGRADGYVMGLYLLDRVEEQKRVKDRRRRRQYDREGTASAMAS
jgi:hypothetical protein